MIDQDLIEKYIEPNPNRPGIANARLSRYGVSVWATIGYLEAEHGDIDRVAEDYGVPREAIEAALAYYRRHREIIDDRRGLNGA